RSIAGLDASELLRRCQLPDAAENTYLDLEVGWCSLAEIDLRPFDTAALRRLATHLGADDPVTLATARTSETSAFAARFACGRGKPAMQASTDGGQRGTLH